MSQIQNNKFRLHLWASSRRELILVVLCSFVVIATVWLSHSLWAEAWGNLFANYLDPMIAVGTLLVAILVWWNEKRKTWRNTWPKRLQIYFLLREEGEWRPQVTVLDAPLTSESDIRTWGISIGGTVVPGKRTSMDFSGFRIASGRLNQQAKTMDYGLLVFLKNRIDVPQDGQVYAYDAEGTALEPIDKVPDAHPIHHLFPHINN